MGKRTGLLLLAACCAAFCDEVLAESAADQGGLEEIVVTAEKRPSTLQKTAAPILVQSGEDLIGQNITDITALGKAVPGLTVGPPLNGASIVYLRGVGQYTISPNAESGVAFIFDGVYAPREMTLTAFFDIDRVEALLGPQGMLYGRNAAGGIINVTTAQPTKRLEGSLLVEGGNYGAIHTTGVMNVPVSDTLVLRGAVDYNKHDGYLSNGLNDNDSTSGRLSMLLTPNEAFSLSASATAYHTGGEGSAISIRVPVPGLSLYAPDPSRPWYDPYPTNGLYNDQRGQFLTANATYRAGGVAVTYLPGYASYDVDGLGQNGSQLLHVVSIGHLISQELRLASDDAGPSKWLTGVYWSKSDPSQFGHIGLPGGASLNDLTGSQSFFTHQESYAAFGQYTYSVTDRVRLTAGGRESEDKVDGTGRLTVNAGRCCNTSGPQIVATPYYGSAMNHNRFDWKVGVETDIAQRSLLYANVQTGYMPGGFTQALPGSGLPTTFQPATLLAYVVGSKNRFLDNRLQINDEVFYYDYRDYQVIYVKAPSSQNLNVPKTKIYGDQLDVDYLVTDSTQVFLSATVMHSAYQAFIDPIAPFHDLHGFQVQQAPNLSGSGGLKQEWSLNSHGKVSGRVQTYYNSGFWSTYSHTPSTHQDRYTKTDVTLTYATRDEKWSFSAYADNLENNAVYATSAVGGLGEIVSTVTPPRTYGLRMIAHFR